MSVCSRTTMLHDLDTRLSRQLKQQREPKFKNTNLDEKKDFSRLFSSYKANNKHLKFAFCLSRRPSQAVQCRRNIKKKRKGQRERVTQSRSDLKRLVHAFEPTERTQCTLSELSVLSVARTSLFRVFIQHCSRRLNAEGNCPRQSTGTRAVWAAACSFAKTGVQRSRFCTSNFSRVPLLRRR